MTERDVIKAHLVGVLKKGEMKHLFGKYNDSLCDYNSISLERIPRTAYVALFRLDNNHFECHLLEDISEWFLKDKNKLPNTRGLVSEADIKRVLVFYNTINPPPPPPPEPSIRIPDYYNGSPNRFEHVTTRRGRNYGGSPNRFQHVTTRRRRR